MRRWRAGDGVPMGWGVFLAYWGLAAAAALALGRDANWDLRNYHYYNAFALLDGRWNVDIAPAGMHTFLHPGLDLPFYLMTQGPLGQWPRLVAALQAGYLGLLAFLALAVANLACHGDAWRASGASALVAAFGLSGAATLAEAGATLNDIQVSCLVVGGLLALLLAPQAERCGRPRRSAALRLLAGASGGAAIGLKLTAAIYPPALVAAALLARPPGAARRVRTLALLGFGGAAGALVVYGPWAWFLFERFGNPFGPFLNQVFHSPWFPPETIRDVRFLPAGPWQALVYPLLWARRSQGLVTESPVADPRFAVGLAALLVVAGSGMWRRLARPSRKRRPDAAQQGAASESAVARRAARAVMAFVLVGYAVWLAGFGILRYLGPIEVLLGVPVWAAARAVLEPAPPVGHRVGGPGAEPAVPGPPRGGATACTAIVFGACALLTVYPEWGRQPFAWAGGPGGSVAVTRVTLPEGSLVAMVGPAVSFTAPFLAGPGIRFIGIPHPGEAGSAAFRTGMAEAVRDVVRSNRGSAFAVVEDPDDYDRQVAEAYGIKLDLASCAVLPNNLTAQVRLCRWTR